VPPIGIWAAGDPARAAKAAREDSRLTHTAPLCVEACAGFAAAIAAGVAGGTTDDMARAALEVLDADARLVRGAIEQGLGGSNAELKASPGHVLLALQNAFCQLARAHDFEDAVAATASAGGETDANAAVAGALLGARHGRQGVPARWILPLLACRPGAAADAFKPRPMEYWPDDSLELAEALLRLSLI
jgi:ADP-ribosylglycohydrolase